MKVFRSQIATCVAISKSDRDYYSGQRAGMAATVRGRGDAMKKLTLLLSILALGFGLVLAQNGEGEDTEEQAQVEGLVTVGLSEQGYLVDGDGHSLYLFVNDDQGPSTCFDDCLSIWPALLVDAELVPGEGVDPELLGQVEREDGTMQVTYNGWPLYYYAADAAAGDTTGQGVGEVWYVLDAEGNALEEL